jgi:hypothetical protein
MGVFYVEMTAFIVSIYEYAGTDAKWYTIKSFHFSLGEGGIGYIYMGLILFLAKIKLLKRY